MSIGSKHLPDDHFMNPVKKWFSRRSGERKRVLTGIKPSGYLHLGNYFGSVEQIKKLQEGDDEIFFFLADLHALTNLNEPDASKEKLEEYSMHILRSYIALGINPKRVCMYRQSDFPQVLELFWIFCCLFNHNYLNIGHAYKEMVAKKGDVGLGVFLYPVLMAADILLPDIDIVPVGKDQVQHVEITRELARKFNLVTRTQYFSQPQERVEEATASILGIDGEKMSKSNNNTIPIFGDEAFIRKRIKSIKTASIEPGQPINVGQCLVCNYLKLLMDPTEYATLEIKSSQGGYTYAELKDLLADAFFAYFGPARERYTKLAQDKNYIPKLLKQNHKKLDELFTKRIAEVKQLLGLSFEA